MKVLFETFINCFFDTNSGFFYLVILTLIDIIIKFNFRNRKRILVFKILIYSCINWFVNYIKMFNTYNKLKGGFLLWIY